MEKKKQGVKPELFFFWWCLGDQQCTVETRPSVYNVQFTKNKNKTGTRHQEHGQVNKHSLQQQPYDILSQIYNFKIKFPNEHKQCILKK